MSSEVKVTVQQQSLTTTEGQARGHKVLIDRPVAKEGTDLGMMGGEMFLVSLGGCFMSNLLAAIRTRSAPVSDIHVDITGALADNPQRFTAIRLDIAATYDDADLVEKLVTIAERGCLVANSLRGHIDLSFNIRQTAQSMD